jgi:hypothetical protein
MWLYATGAVVLVVLVTAFWRKIVRAVLLLAGMGLVGLIAWAFAQQATATRQVATAATAAARGGAAINIVVAVLAGVFCLGAAVLAVYVLARRWMLQQEWGAARMGAALPYPQMQAPQMHDSGAVNALVQLEVLRALRDLRSPQQTALVLERDEGDDDGYAGWWGA